MRDSRTRTIVPESSALKLAETLARKRSGPGVIMFSEKLQLLFLNQEAMACNERLAKADPSSSGRGLFSPLVMALCEEVAGLLKSRRDPKEWEHFQVLRVVEVRPNPILLRGIGIPSSNSVLILMEVLSQRERTSLSVPVQHRLSGRERAVVTCLAGGMTNKEIAEELGLSEHTVKDHLKNIMHKTSTHTRTALLMKVAYPGGFKIAEEGRARWPEPLASGNGLVAAKDRGASSV